MARAKSNGKFAKEGYSLPIEAGDGEEFFAEIFDRGAEMVCGWFVDDQETVVGGAKLFNCDCWVLLVVFSNIEGEGWSDLFGVNDYLCPFAPLGK